MTSHGVKFVVANQDIQRYTSVHALSLFNVSMQWIYFTQFVHINYISYNNYINHSTTFSPTMHCCPKLVTCQSLQYSSTLAGR